MVLRQSGVGGAKQNSSPLYRAIPCGVPDTRWVVMLMGPLRTPMCTLHGSYFPKHALQKTGLAIVVAKIIPNSKGMSCATLLDTSTHRAFPRVPTRPLLHPNSASRPLTPYVQPHFLGHTCANLVDHRHPIVDVPSSTLSARSSTALHPGCQQHDSARPR